MGCGKEELDNCLRTVNVVLNERVVLQGRIIRGQEEERKTEVYSSVGNDGGGNGNPFITLELICDAFIIRDNAELKTISPTLFAQGDIVRVNIADISVIGPSHVCPDEEA